MYVKLWIFFGEEFLSLVFLFSLADNVEVQLLPKPIIPEPPPRRRTRKRAKFDYSEEGREEILALELRAAIAKRTSINLSSLTNEESWMDLANMKAQVRPST